MGHFNHLSFTFKKRIRHLRNLHRRCQALNFLEKIIQSSCIFSSKVLDAQFLDCYICASEVADIISDMLTVSDTVLPTKIETIITTNSQVSEFEKESSHTSFSSLKNLIFTTENMYNSYSLNDLIDSRISYIAIKDLLDNCHLLFSTISKCRHVNLKRLFLFKKFDNCYVPLWFDLNSANLEFWMEKMNLDPNAVLANSEEIFSPLVAASTCDELLHVLKKHPFIALPTTLQTRFPENSTNYFSNKLYPKLLTEKVISFLLQSDFYDSNQLELLHNFLSQEESSIDFSCLNVLLSHKRVNINHKSSKHQGASPLHKLFANNGISSECFSQLFKTLFEHGVDLNCVDFHLRSVLHTAHPNNLTHYFTLCKSNEFKSSSPIHLDTVDENGNMFLQPSYFATVYSYDCSNTVLSIILNSGLLKFSDALVHSFCDAVKNIPSDKSTRGAASNCITNTIELVKHFKQDILQEKAALSKIILACFYHPLLKEISSVIGKDVISEEMKSRALIIENFAESVLTRIEYHMLIMDTLDSIGTATDEQVLKSVLIKCCEILYKELAREEEELSIEKSQGNTKKPMKFKWFNRKFENTEKSVDHQLIAKIQAVERVGGIRPSKEQVSLVMTHVIKRATSMEKVHCFAKQYFKQGYDLTVLYHYAKEKSSTLEEFQKHHQKPIKNPKWFNWCVKVFTNQRNKT